MRLGSIVIARWLFFEHDLSEKRVTLFRIEF